MKRLINYVVSAILVVLLISTACNRTVISVDSLKCNYTSAPSGISDSLTLSWTLMSSERNQSQSAYRIIISNEADSIKKNLRTVWDSEKVDSKNSIGVSTGDLGLDPGTRYFWKVKVWDSNNIKSPWSKEATFITALSEKDDWNDAQWITMERSSDSISLVPGIPRYGNENKANNLKRPTTPLFRKEFELDKKIKSALLFISGLGHYKAYLNGEQIEEHFLSPGWTDYSSSCLYNTYDITNELNTGGNAIGVIVGNGFYHIQKERYTKLLISYGMPKLIAKIQIEYTDGTSESIVTGDDWLTYPSPITFSSIYGGESYDARLEQQGWNQVGFDDQHWQKAQIARDPGGELIAETTYPLRVKETLSPEKITQLGQDTVMIDFGQNASGIVRIEVEGNLGDTIRITPAELIYDDNSPNQSATGRPYYYEYILKGEGIETWEPMFTYYGFRYAQIIGADFNSADGNSPLPQLLEIRMLHTSNSAPETGSFWCSNPLFNSIDTLIRYAIQSNYQSALTDCPHREKLGWLEQTYLMGGSIQHNYETYHIFTKIIRDMMSAQRNNGLIPSIAPEYVVFGDAFTDSPEWGSAIIILPYMVNKWYGDIGPMSEAWESMNRYLTYLDSKAENNILDYGLGDWYDLGPNPPGIAQLTPISATATALFYHDYQLMSEMASLLGKEEESADYFEKAEQIKLAYNNELFNQETGVYSDGSQTSMAIPLSMGIVEKKYENLVLDNLVDSIRANNMTVTAGDIGFHYLVDALTKGNQTQLLYDMNNRDDVPGYGYQIKKEATALTESWEALPGKSNNHMMLGHIEEWLYTGLGGIRQENTSTAYEHTVIHPIFPEGLEEVKTSYRSAYGTIRSEWKNTPNETEILVEIPVNTQARIVLPTGTIENISESGQSLSEREDIEIIESKDGSINVRIGSGEYHFNISKSKIGGRKELLPELVSQELMNQIYEEVKTPFKYGLIMVPDSNSYKMDCPTIYRKDNKWIMTYIVFDGRGYETWLADSDNLIEWVIRGKIMEFSDQDDWDINQKAGYPSLIDYEWEGEYKIQSYDDKYWMSYFGGNSEGYEKGLLSIGIAFTEENPSEVHSWDRLDKPVLKATDEDARWYDNNTIYKNYILRDKDKLTGYPFIMYYNARGDSLNPERGAERISLAVSNDMINWVRYGDQPLINHHKGISGDAVIQKIDDVFVMFYFGAFWPDEDAAAFNRFACSYDLVNWTEWDGPHLIEPSEAYDDLFAHKSFVIKHHGIVYHFYNAVDKLGNRGIALATSEDTGKSKLTFNSTEESEIK